MSGNRNVISSCNLRKKTTKLMKLAPYSVGSATNKKDEASTSTDAVGGGVLVGSFGSVCDNEMKLAERNLIMVVKVAMKKIDE